MPSTAVLSPTGFDPTTPALLQAGEGWALSLLAAGAHPPASRVIGALSALEVNQQRLEAGLTQRIEGRLHLGGMALALEGAGTLLALPSKAEIDIEGAVALVVVPAGVVRIAVDKLAATEFPGPCLLRVEAGDRLRVAPPKGGMVWLALMG